MPRDHIDGVFMLLIDRESHCVYRKCMCVNGGGINLGFKYRIAGNFVGTSFRMNYRIISLQLRNLLRVVVLIFV